MRYKKRSSHDAVGILMRVAEYWSAILLATVLCASALFSYGRFVLSPQFTSTSVLYTLNRNAGEMSEAELDTSLAKDCAFAAGSQAVLSQVIKDQTLSYTYKELADKIQVECPSGSHIVRITVTDRSSESAKELADAVADATVAYVSGEMGQNAPRVLSYGFVGGRSITVSPVRFAVTGAILGFLVSVIICIIKAMSDDRILFPGDLKSSGYEVIAVMPGEE